MSSGPILMTADASAYRALGEGGEPVWRRAAQLRAAIDTRLGKRHADLFAIPQDQVGRIEWRAPFDGTAQSYIGLSETEKRALEAKVQELRPDLVRLVERLDTAGRSDGERAFGRLLRQALLAPGPETLFSVDTRPVLAFWGFSAEGAAGTLLGIVAAPAPGAPAWSPGPAAPAPSAPTQTGWTTVPTSAPTMVGQPPPAPLAAASPGWTTVPGAAPATQMGQPPTGRPPPPPGGPPPYGAPPPQAGPAAYGMPPPQAGQPPYAAPPPQPGPSPATSGWWKGMAIALAALILLAVTAWFVKPYLPDWVWDGTFTMPPTASTDPGSSGVDDSVLRAERAREDALKADFARLWAQFNDKRNQCRPGQSTDLKGDRPPPATNEEVTRRGGRIGRMNVVLSWQGGDDLDVHVVCPSGEVINYQETRHCGGTLDVDANHVGVVENPVENVVWDEPPRGRYKILVARFEDRDPKSATTPFTVELKVNGQVVKSASGAADGTLQEVFSFDVPLPEDASSSPPPRKP